MVVVKIFVSLFIAFFASASLSSLELDNANPSYDARYFKVMLPKDGIKAVSDPQFKPLSRALLDNELNYLVDDDWLVLVEYKNQRRLYPIKSLIWHEIVNDRFGDEDVIVTYCILTNSVLVFRGYSDGQRRSFGVSGMLLQSNLVMYDRQTGSLWSQLALKAVSGSQLGKTCPALPFSLVRLDYAKQIFSDTVIFYKSNQFAALQEMYVNRPFNGLENYENDQQIRAPLDPRFLANKRFSAKEAMLYFPSDNKALPLSKAGQHKQLVDIILNNKAERVMVTPRSNKVFYTMSWFALCYSYPDAITLE